ncbi:hypothetical protein [Streptomyces armeniacus]|uniref:hypothetical protein n=1 Tax=Streptomyces armeniacus TaxID=83291 RepID=UPI001AD81896|nr:hypothetical protein [Streptomyces armeniacus]
MTATERRNPLRPRFVPVIDLQHRWRHRPRLDAAALRAEADEFYGGEDRVDRAEDPLARRRGDIY